MQEIIEKYKNAEIRIWAQDEPENQGAWPFIQRKLGYMALKPVTRPESASPAGGLIEQHKKRLARIINAIFGVDKLCLEKIN
jgi:2-oxoglutarate dehydrogenase E1 component